MLKDITNKAVKAEKTKHVEDTVLDTVLVNLKNNTLIDGKVYPAGQHEVARRQYELVKRFL